MTYEEAKMQIQAIPEKIWDQLSEPDREAMEMAFSALHAQDSPKPKAESVQNVQNEDLISRKAAIDVLATMQGLCTSKAALVQNSKIWQQIKDLPSAQPEPCEDAVSREAVTDIIRHSDIFSTWYEMDDTDDIVAEVIDEARKQLVDDVNELPSVTPKCPECDDAVSREAAIDAAENAFVRGLLASPDIRKLPSVQPERKTGWWLIREGISDAQCSECGMYFRDVYDMENSDAFCRHCGAKMEGLKVVEDE